MDVILLKIDFEKTYDKCDGISCNKRLEWKGLTQNGVNGYKSSLPGGVLELE
jgi:hypothetical protein